MCCSIKSSKQTKRSVASQTIRGGSGSATTISTLIKVAKSALILPLQSNFKNKIVYEFIVWPSFSGSLNSIFSSNEIYIFDLFVIHSMESFILMFTFGDPDQRKLASFKSKCHFHGKFYFNLFISGFFFQIPLWKLKSKQMNRVLPNWAKGVWITGRST